MDLLGRIDAWASLAPDRCAHVSASGSLSYAELAAGSNAVAASIQRELGDDRSPVVVQGHKQPAMLLGFLGSVKAGHPYVPVDSSTPEQRVAQIVQRAGARCVLTQESIGRALARGGSPERVSMTASDTWYVMFTSGSTGEPKGVAITLGNLNSFLSWMHAEHQFADGGEVFLNQAPFSFDLSVMDLYLSLTTGGTLVSLSAEEIADPKRMYAALAGSGVTTWVSTPSFAQLCLIERRFDAALLPHVRRFLFCGETLPPGVAAQLLERFPRSEVWNTYGPTEATVATTSLRIDERVLERYPVLPVGYAKPGSQVLIVDGEGQVLAQGQRGEIVIAGPNVSPGYVGRPDLSERRFFARAGQWAYRTGDWGHLVDGLLFWDGRMDDQIKLHGHRIELGDVEANLRAVEGVRDAAVVALARDQRVDALAAFVIPSEWPTDTGFDAAQRFRRALAERVPAYMVPRVVRIVATLPLTANGKVDRRALAEALA